MKSTQQILLTLLVIIITTVVVQAQPGMPAAPSQAPIDGGLSLLAVAGGYYALNRLMNKSHK